jgi:type IV pilus assembly protein PilV
MYQLSANSLSSRSLNGSAVPQRRMGQRGVTLIEVLVSILVLSVGLLGMMGLQAAALRYEQGAWARTAVSSSVADFSDGIRMLPTVLPATIESIRTYSTELAATEDAAYFVPDVDCDLQVCTADQLAAFARTFWRRNIHNSFPAGVGFVQQTGVPGRSLAYALTVAWADKSLVDTAGAPTTAPVCAGNEQLAAARNCCPAEIEAPAGVRCARVVVLP